MLAIHHAASQPIKTITFGKTSIDATHLERFWLAGKGWVMAGDLKPGDHPLARAGCGGLPKIEDAEPQPVYHVQVGEGRECWWAQFGILAHDEQVGRPVASPFDSAAIEGSQTVLIEHSPDDCSQGFLRVFGGQTCFLP